MIWEPKDCKTCNSDCISVCFDPWQELDSEVGIIWHYARNSECRRTTVVASSPVSIKVSGTLNMISRYIYIWCPHEFPSVWKCESCVPESSRVISLHISVQVTWHRYYLATWQGGHLCSFKHKMTVLYCFNHWWLNIFVAASPLMIDIMRHWCQISSHTYDHAWTADTLPTTTPGQLIQ